MLESLSLHFGFLLLGPDVSQSLAKLLHPLLGFNSGHRLVFVPEPHEINLLLHGADAGGLLLDVLGHFVVLLAEGQQVLGCDDTLVDFKGRGHFVQVAVVADVLLRVVEGLVIDFAAGSPGQLARLALPQSFVPVQAGEQLAGFGQVGLGIRGPGQLDGRCFHGSGYRKWI